MKRLKTDGKYDKTVPPFHFEGDVESFKDYITDLCKDLSDFDELSFYADQEGDVYVEVSKFSVESDEDFKERLLKRKQLLEEDVAKLNTELNQISKELI